MANGKPAFYFDLDVLPTGDVWFTSVEGKKTFRGLMGVQDAEAASGRRPERSPDPSALAFCGERTNGTAPVPDASTPCPRAVLRRRTQRVVCANREGA